jgi:threonine dehydrogenase-like Zn-dependent dehydrogenase
MKALVYTAQRRLELQDLAVPTIKPDEALVRIRAIGVCGSDLHGFLGKSKKRIPPLVLGHEFCGEVAEVGSQVVGFKPGDPVVVYPLIACGHCRFCQNHQENICPDRKVYGLDFHGGLAEYVSVPRHCLFQMPSGMSFLEGSLVEPLANAIHVMEKCGKVQGQTGVVIGAGPIGLCVLWVARQQGADKLAIVDINPRRLSTVMNLGPDLVVDASKQEPVRAILDWTRGHGADFSVDAVGNSVCRRNSIDCTATGGTSVWIGLEEDLCEIDSRAVVTREVQIRGTYAYTKADFARAISLLETKALPHETFTHIADFADGQSIFDDFNISH